MPADIQTFYNIAQQKQFSRDFFMRVKQITIAGLQLNGENELVFAKTATLPGRQIEDKPINYSGQIFHANGRALYTGSESYSIDFYMDQQLDLRTKLEKASRRLFNNEDTTGQMCMPGNDSFMILDVLGVPCGLGNQGGAGLQIVQTIKFIGVSIRDVGAVSYSIADGTGEILTLPATFSYHWYEDFSR